MIKPTNTHLHLRKGQMLSNVICYTAMYFAQAIIEPNTDPPVLNAEDAVAYKKEILDAMPEGYSFEPIITMQITPKTTPAMIDEAYAAGVRVVKSYAWGVTTNSLNGIKEHEYRRLYPVYERIAELDMRSQYHGELPSAYWEDREAKFIDRVFDPLVKSIPGLHAVFEHISTRYGVNYIKQAPANIAASITCHHPVMTANNIVGTFGKIKPHHFCLPMAKRLRDQEALFNAMWSGDPHFFLGLDCAPHLKGSKECADGCGGMFTSIAAIPLLVELAEIYGGLDELIPFTSVFGPAYYNLPIPTETITMVKKPWVVPQEIHGIVPFMAGETLNWQLAE